MKEVRTELSTLLLLETSLVQIVGKTKARSTIAWKERKKVEDAKRKKESKRRGKKRKDSKFSKQYPRFQSHVFGSINLVGIQIAAISS